MEMVKILISEAACEVREGLEKFILGESLAPSWANLTRHTAHSGTTYRHVYLTHAVHCKLAQDAKWVTNPGL